MLNQLVTECRRDRRELFDYLRELIDWAGHVAQWRLPRVVEARRRLRVVQGRLDRLFDRQEVIANLIAESKGRTSPELDALRRRAEDDRFHLRQRLAALILRLEKAEAEFADWKPVLYELSLFVDSIEQHAEWFCDSVGWMIPPSESVRESGNE
jgi:hypothetical protein